MSPTATLVEASTDGPHTPPGATDTTPAPVGPADSPASPISDSPARPRSNAPVGPTGGRPRSRFARLFLGASDDPAWARPGLWALLVATAALYLVNLTSSGYANEFYAAAVKSSTKSWTAWLFASLDSGLSITVDKPPAAIWVMGLSARLFGFSSASLLVPQALMGVATVALVYGAVRRTSGHAAGLIGGALVALTPVAALMFRFDNPDALLTLLMTAASYAVVRAIQTLKGRRALGWMVAAGWLIGLAFLTKMLQGMLVLPALGLVYLLAANRPLLTRLGHLLAAAASMIVSAGWLIALVAIWPASSRPYIGGSTTNSLLELALGYNGLGRLFGGSGNGGGGSMGGGSNTNSGFGGTAGLLRMFNSAFGTEVSWFIPAALLLLVAGLAFMGRRPRTDLPRAGLILWGGSFVVTALVFSFMEGTIHPYYAVALAPVIAGTIAVGGKELYDRAGKPSASGLIARGLLALSVMGTAVWGFYLLATTAASWYPALRWVALIGGVVGALVWFLAGLASSSSLTLRRLAAGALIAAAVSSVAPSAAWTLATASSAHSGSIPTSGPAVAGNASGMGAMGEMGGQMGGMGGQMGGMGGQMGDPPSGMRPQGGPGGTGTTGTTSGTSGTGSGTSGTASATTTSGTASGTSGTTSGTASGTALLGGGMGASSSTELIALLNQAGTKWSAAVVGDQTAAGYILSTDTAVYCIGGWSGSDNNVTLTQFKALVASGQIHYFISGGMGGSQGGSMGGSSRSASEITAWVTSTFKSSTVGSTTVYDLTTKA